MLKYGPLFRRWFRMAFYWAYQVLIRGPCLAREPWDLLLRSSIPKEGFLCYATMKDILPPNRAAYSIHVQVDPHACVYLHVHADQRLHARIRKYTCTHTKGPPQQQTHTHTHVNVHTCTPANKLKDSQNGMHACMHANMHVPMHAYR